MSTAKGVIRMVQFMNQYYSYRGLDIYSSSYHIDKLLRTALCGSASAFSAEIQAVEKSFQSMYVSDLSNTLSQLAIYSNDPQKLKAINRSKLFSTNHKWIGCSSFIQTCLFGCDELISELTEEYLAEKTTIFQPSFTEVEYPIIYNPSYWLLITGAYKRSPDSIRKFAKNEFELTNVTWAAVSAAVFEDDDFLELLFSSGYIPNAELFAQLIYFPEKLMGMANRLGKYFLSDECSCTSIPEIIEAALDDNEIVQLINLLYACDHTMQIPPPDTKLVPKIKTVLSSDICFVVDKNIAPYLDKIFASKVKIIVNVDTPVSEYEKYINAELEYEVSSDVSFFSISSLMSLFKKNAVFNIRNDGEALSSTLLCMLDKNNTTIYNHMIKKGIINSENLDKVLDHLSQNNLIKGLQAIRKNIKMINDFSAVLPKSTSETML